MDNLYEDQQGIEIPPDQLPAETLQAVIEEFVMREGTDYGEVEWSLEDKVAQLRGQLQRGELALYFDPVTESCTLVAKGS